MEQPKLTTYEKLMLEGMSIALELLCSIHNIYPGGVFDTKVSEWSKKVKEKDGTVS